MKRQFMMLVLAIFAMFACAASRGLAMANAIPTPIVVVA